MRVVISGSDWPTVSAYGVVQMLHATVAKGARRHAAVAKWTRRHAAVAKGTRRHAAVAKGTRRHAAVAKWTRRHATVAKGARRHGRTAVTPVLTCVGNRLTKLPLSIRWFRIHIAQKIGNAGITGKGV